MSVVRWVLNWPLTIAKIIENISLSRTTKCFRLTVSNCNAVIAPMLMLMDGKRVDTQPMRSVQGSQVCYYVKAPVNFIKDYLRPFFSVALLVDDLQLFGADAKD